MDKLILNTSLIYKKVTFKSTSNKNIDLGDTENKNYRKIPPKRRNTDSK